MSVSEEIKEDVVQGQILQAAKRLFQQYGFRKVTMDDVAKAIGKGRSSLYYYYKSKEEVLDAVLEVEINEMMGAITDAVNKASTAEQKLHAFCVTKLTILKERGAFYNTMDIGMDAEEISSFNKAKLVIHRRIMKREGTLLGKIFNYGIEKGELKPMTEQEQSVLIFVLLCSIRGLKREMTIENDFSGIIPAVDALTKMSMHGLRE